jgi:hypothetical protein
MSLTAATGLQTKTPVGRPSQSFFGGHKAMALTGGVRELDWSGVEIGRRSAASSSASARTADQNQDLKPAPAARLLFQSWYPLFHC